MNITTLDPQLNAVIAAGLKDTAPAVALAVYRRGDLILNSAWGEVASQQPTRPDTLFDLASVTKLFTVTAFLTQVAEGRAGLHMPVVTVIPEFRKYGPRPLDGGQDPHTLEMLPAEVPPDLRVDPGAVTFYHLLTHTGGLAPWRDLFLHTGPIPPPPPQPSQPSQPDPVTHAERLAKALDLIAGYAFVGRPGGGVQYSDLGLILLGEAVRRLDGADTLAQAIAARVTGPLGLPNTGFCPAEPARCVPTENDERWRGRRCRGEVHDENAAGLGGIAGHAGLFGVAAEVARLGQAWLDALAGRVEGWLPPGLAQNAIHPHVEDRGLGWMLKSPTGYSTGGTRFSPRSFGHTGFTGTALWVDPERDISAALLTNRVYHGRDISAIRRFRPACYDALNAWIDTL
ncbi:MAG: beta-lactamase family protein [Anaerolineae bacterium]|nr:beta-lactamase family protein [Anaerolineae bacterium]